jgi:hypothetical protein
VKWLPWRRKPEPYPCVGPEYPSPSAAHFAVEQEVAERADTHVLVSTPLIYRCHEGHYHARVHWLW